MPCNFYELPGGLYLLKGTIDISGKNNESMALAQIVGSASYLY
jgi:hypothetical protein